MLHIKNILKSKIEIAKLQKMRNRLEKEIENFYIAITMYPNIGDEKIEGACKRTFSKIIDSIMEIENRLDEINQDLNTERINLIEAHYRWLFIFKEKCKDLKDHL